MTQELNCSDAAKMLIERMATHPEDFEPNGRFWGVMQFMRGEPGIGAPSYISDRDLKAVNDAAQQLHEDKLMEYVLHKLLVNEEKAEITRRTRNVGKLNTVLNSMQMAQQGSSLHPDLQYPAPNPYAYPTGGSST